MAREKRRRWYHWRVLAQRSRGENVQVGPLDDHDGTPSQFDELVVGHWIHLERMDTRAWWMALGELRLWIQVMANGTVIVTNQETGKRLTP